MTNIEKGADNTEHRRATNDHVKAEGKVEHESIDAN
jgi:hypothetical protein